MNLVYYPADILSKKLDEVDVNNLDFNPHDLKKEMVDIMLSNHGIGLSANQVNLQKQIFIMGDTEKNISMLINPMVLQHTKEVTNELEGCLSFPGIFVNVKRPKEILVEYLDENLDKKRTHITGYSVKVFLHEWDHLQGITFKDRVSVLVWKMANKKAHKKGFINA